MKHYTVSLFGLMTLTGLLMLSACSGKNKLTGKKDMNVIILDRHTESPFNNGRFQGWGTSFCWWANRIGYSDELAEKAAEAFYDADKGLGLNIIRYNIGGGDDPAHHHIKRTDSAVPGYLNRDAETGKLSYDWSADFNQRNVLKASVKACGQDVIVEAFANSPPYFMTYSGCSSGAEDKSKNNLRDDQYGAFADYLSTVIEHYRKDEGITFQSVAPMNEPASNYWGALSEKQEGCHFSQGESQSRMILEMAKSLQSNGLGSVIICGTDETSVDVQSDSFNKLSPEAKAVISRIDTHTYQGIGLKHLHDIAVENKKNLWMSEVDGGDTAGMNAGEMGAALWFAKKIVSDMNGLMPSAWIMWQVIDNHISSEGFNGNKDYGMPDTSRGYWGLAVCNHDTKEIILTKKYYAMAQFSRFIRPGCTLIGSSRNTLAAYDSGKKQVIIVAVNDDSNDDECTFDISQFKKTGSSVSAVRTSGSLAAGENLASQPQIPVVKKTFSAVLLANSITTFVIENVF
jgi:O-glycosyl hydrolase